MSYKILLLKSEIFRVSFIEFFYKVLKFRSDCMGKSFVIEKYNRNLPKLDDLNVFLVLMVF